MKEDLISIILPVYNRRKYLFQAINSVLQQSYQNWELIIADDNSDKDTRIFLKKYAAIPRVKIYYNPTNIGLFPNLNQAIRRCNSDYITILCSDDFFLPQCLENNLDLMKKYPEANLLLSSANAVSANGDLLPSEQNFYCDCIAKQTRLLQPEQSVPLLLQYGSINGSITGMFFKKSLYEQIGSFREDWRHAADWEWLYRVASYSPILLSRVNVAVLRVHEEQLSVVNGRNLSASLEGAEMVKMLLADPRLRTLESASKWAKHRMQFHLWFALKLALQGHWSESLTISRAVEKASGLGSTFWMMLRLLPHRWQVYRQKSFFLPPN